MSRTLSAAAVLPAKGREAARVPRAVLLRYGAVSAPRPAGPGGAPSQSPATPLSSTSPPPRGPGLFSSAQATGQADSALIPTSPGEMFACSGIYSHSLRIKERMGIIFPVGRRAYFLWPVTEEWPSGPPGADSGLGCLGQGDFAPQALNQVPGESLTHKQLPPPEGGRAIFTPWSLSRFPSVLPHPHLAIGLSPRPLVILKRDNRARSLVNVGELDALEDVAGRA